MSESCHQPVAAIDVGTFRDCLLLQDVELHDGLQRIEAEAFMSCPSLEQIQIPSTVKVVGQNSL